ncbi:MAG: flippase-like domain-containing protein [Actinomycetota bacterium]|nr:flippase-like domain-containing protein [Actinomycetota bacterium]
MTPSQPGEIEVTDQLERRIRKPVDLLRCTLSSAEIVALALAGIAASATTTGVETDIVGASRRLPHVLLEVAPPVALFALLILPVVLAAQLLLRRQLRRVAEAVATGIVAAAASAVVDSLLRHAAAARLYDAIIMSRPGASDVAALDTRLAGLVAYATMIGLVGRPAWRNALWVAVGVYSVVQVETLHTTVLSLLITLAAGRAIGLAVRYVAGSTSQRPSARDIATALDAAKVRVAAIRRVRPARAGAAGSRRYAVTTQDGIPPDGIPPDGTAEPGSLDVVVYDRDQQAAGAIYRIYRSVRLLGPVSRTAPLSVDHEVERRALLTYAAEDAGAPTPRLRALVRVGPEAAALAYTHHEGTTLADRNPGCSDAELRQIWDAVDQLHAHRVTHRGLTADRILLTNDGQAMLLDLGDGDVAASDLQIRLDLAQLLAELALYVGPGRAASLALEKASADELVAVVPLLQPVALARSTRAALRRRRDVLPALRKLLLAAVPGREVAHVRVERIRLRTLLTLVASLVAAYLLAGELARASLTSVLRSADWRWGIVALALSAVTYVGAAMSLSGFVTERLSFVRTLLVQLAGSFVTLVTPAAVGGAALNVRYLQRKKVPAAVAAASVGVAQVVAFVQHILLLVVFAAIAGTSTKDSIQPPKWAYFVLAGLVVVALAVLAVPAGRRLLRARVSPIFGQVLPRLLEVAQHPRKLALGIGGALLLSATYILCLAACVAAFGRSVPIASIAVVYLTGSAIGSILPTPGGIGGVEAALTAGLTAAGLPGAVAVSSVLLFRLLTFWFPVPVGWAALSFLERKQVL